MYIIALKLGQVNPLIHVKWVTFSPGHVGYWITHWKPDNVVYIFKNGDSEFRVFVNIDCHSSKHIQYCMFSEIIFAGDYVLKKKKRER